MSRSYDDPPGFWTFFFAVLMALIAHDLIRLAAVAVTAREAVKELERHIGPATTPGHLPARPGRVERAAPVKPQVPYLNGPIAATKYGDDKACINGRVAHRLDNGWRQDYDSRCEQAAP